MRYVNWGGFLLLWGFIALAVWLMACEPRGLKADEQIALQRPHDCFYISQVPASPDRYIYMGRAGDQLVYVERQCLR